MEPFFGTTAGMQRELNTRSFFLAASINGRSWTKIDQRDENTDNVTDVDLEPVAGRYLKLTIDKPGVDSIVRIGDVEFYGL